MEMDGILVGLARVVREFDGSFVRVPSCMHGAGHRAHGNEEGQISGLRAWAWAATGGLRRRAGAERELFN